MYQLAQWVLYFYYFLPLPVISVISIFNTYVWDALLSIYFIPDSMYSGDNFFISASRPFFFSSSSSTIETFPKTIAELYLVENVFGWRHTSFTTVKQALLLCIILLTLYPTAFAQWKYIACCFLK